MDRANVGGTCTTLVKTRKEVQFLLKVLLTAGIFFTAIKKRKKECRRKAEKNPFECFIYYTPCWQETRSIQFNMLLYSFSSLNWRKRRNLLLLLNLFSCGCFCFVLLSFLKKGDISYLVSSYIPCQSWNSQKNAFFLRYCHISNRQRRCLKRKK